MSLDLSKIRSTSLLPGLQNLGTVSSIATISGTIPAKGNLIGSFVLSLPTPDSISALKISLPDAHGDLVNWFPVFGSLELYDATTQFYTVIYVASNSSGRLISFDLINDTGSDITLTNWRIDAFAHVYSYPF